MSDRFVLWSSVGAMVAAVVTFVWLTWPFHERFKARGEPIRPEVYVTSPKAGAPRCIQERRMHAYGTYRAVRGGGVESDLPVDLTIMECLRWE